MWLEEIFKGGTEGIFKGVRDVVTTFKADPLELAKLEAALNQAQMQASVSLVQAQTEVNKLEAASNDRFASRWRPAVGWVCVTGLAYATLFYPIATWVCLNIHEIPPPQLSLDVLMPMLTGLLGIAGLRTYEKTR